MIKIFKLDFNSKTIDNIEITGDDITNLEIKLTETTFKISYIKENKIVSKEIKKNEYIDKEEIKIEIEEPEEQPEPQEQQEPEPEPEPEPEQESEEESEPEEEPEEIKEGKNKMKKICEELKLYQDNKKLGAERVYKYKKIKVNFRGFHIDPTIIYPTRIGRGGFVYDDSHKGSDDVCHLLYGDFEDRDAIFKEKNKKNKYPECKTGIEILGMTRTLTCDNKYKYEGISMKDLSRSLKRNGIKGYSTADKTELVKLLMKADCI